jgi:hypothetical protein
MSPDGHSAAPGRSHPKPKSSTCPANARHSTYSLRFARIAYRWHPLFGRTLQVSPFRRGKDLKCIYTEERPDLCRELPNWMFDEAYCGGMTLGLPEVDLAALHDLGKVLALLNKTRTRTARFSSAGTISSRCRLWRRHACADLCTPWCRPLIEGAIQYVLGS